MRSGVFRSTGWDLRLSKDVRLARTLRVTGIAEVFNLFNHANYGAYNGQVNSVTFGAPAQNLVNSYLPRGGAVRLPVLLLIDPSDVGESSGRALVPPVRPFWRSVVDA